MRIALRPSGGRGDYELTGSYNGFLASELLEKHFYFQITPSLTIDGKARAHRLSGKPRIRPEESGKHPYIVISSILLLPPPRRELIRTPAVLNALSSREYTLAVIDVDLVEANATQVVFAPTTIWAKNQGGILKIDFSDRMALITLLWAAARQQNSELSTLLIKHENAVNASDHNTIQKAAQDIQRRYKTDNDVLPSIFSELQLWGDPETSYTGVSDVTDGYESEDNNSSPAESFRERIRKWRKQADRGPGARDFSVAVRNAYDYRCFFSGERFPKLAPLNSAGVDGAHILPWSSHQLNSVVNGLCLCKQCHWGFDNGLLKLDFDYQSNLYVLSVPPQIEVIARQEDFDLEPFKRNLGPLTASRLPKNQDLWPSPAHIRNLNDKLSFKL